MASVIACRKDAVGLRRAIFVGLAAIGAVAVSLPLLAGGMTAHYFKYIAAFAWPWALGALVLRYAGCLLRDSPDHPFDHLRHYHVLRDWQRAGPLALVVVLFVPSFMAAKTAYTATHAFTWDATFARWDGLLHGRAPWQWLDPIFGNPFGVGVLALVYSAWFFVLFGVLLWEVWRCDARFLLAFLWTWILLGLVLAFLFPAAGPCYYGRVVDGPDIYAPLLNRLHRLNPLVEPTQERVWQITMSHGSLCGVSAMPSVHVATVVLLALWAWRSPRRLVAWAFTAFAVLTQCACVYLGWHYAIDGYAGALGAGLIWRAAGRTTPAAAATKLALSASETGAQTHSAGRVRP
jgi:hypothetical protein